jgi:hypothetical protein
MWPQNPFEEKENPDPTRPVRLNDATFFTVPALPPSLRNNFAASTTEET